jgi:hypothetical protein
LRGIKISKPIPIIRAKAKDYIKDITFATKNGTAPNKFLIKCEANVFKNKNDQKV